MVAAMGKKAGKPAAKAAEGEGADAPKKRSKLKLALFALAPLLVLGGGGYGAWAVFFAAPAEAEVHADAHKPDPEAEAAAWRAVASESSYTHSFALSVLIQNRCGRVRAPALKAASDEEAKVDGLLAQLSWMAASRRADVLTEKSCGYVVSEIEEANAKAFQAATAKAGKDKGGKGGH